jgi:hypothetical protein
MIPDELREKLQNIVNGAILEGRHDSCTAVRNLLCRSFGTSPTVKSEFQSKSILKEKQAGFLKADAEETDTWLDFVPAGSQYLTRGGESLVYFSPDKKHVIKCNDARYYATWTEYFNSLAIHNLLFPATEYVLLGFTSIGEQLFAVLEQRYVQGGQADLTDIRELLTFNGFENIKRQDYYNSEFGLLLEDMHDENVIARDSHLFFIDTVFYIMQK